MKLLEVLISGVKPTLTTRAWHRAQERLRHPKLRALVSKLLVIGRPAAKVSTVHVQALKELQSDGFTMLTGFVSTTEIAQIRESLRSLPCFDPWRVQLGDFNCDQIPAHTHVAQIRMAPRLARLHELANDPKVIGVVSAYFGCKPYLDSIQAWWSSSGHQEPEEAENFHRDNDSIRFLKLFLYATDVGLTNGPHVFVAGSHSSPRLNKRGRLSDQEVENTFGREAIRYMTGVAGDAFLEDTYGIHKGQLPQEGRRLLIQFRYSVTETVFRSPLIVAPSEYYQSKLITSLLHEH